MSRSIVTILSTLLFTTDAFRISFPFNSYHFKRNIPIKKDGWILCAESSPSVPIIQQSKSDGGDNNSSSSRNNIIMTLKLAVDSQWGVAERAPGGISDRFTSASSLDMVHRLRRDSDAVLVGKTTVQVDNPSLTIRRVPLLGTLQPTRIILDTNLSLRYGNYTLFQDSSAPTLLYHADTCDYSQSDVSSWKDHVTCIGVPTKITSNGEDNATLCVSTIWNDLRETRNFSHVMVEGGPTVAHAFLRQGLIDRVLLVQATQIRFQDPYPSYMNLDILKQYGFDLLGCVDRGDGDIVYCLSKPNLPWPTKNLIDWP